MLRNHKIVDEEVLFKKSILVSARALISSLGIQVAFKILSLKVFPSKKHLLESCMSFLTGYYTYCSEYCISVFCALVFFIKSVNNITVKDHVCIVVIILGVQ